MCPPAAAFAQPPVLPPVQPPVAPDPPTAAEPPAEPADPAPAPAAPPASAPTAPPAPASTAPAPAPTAPAPTAPVPAAAGSSNLADLDGDGDIDEVDAAIAAEGEVIEVRGASEADRLRGSARAVTVVDLEEASQRSADLGEVLSRAQGVQVRRSGGLGSATRFSLNGLYDDQIRFFLDGVPLEYAGWTTGVANVPVDIVDRVDVHRGVVPIALGADALGGAVDLVTDPRWTDRAAASYQAGSFGTHRATLFARARHDRTGFAAGLSLAGDRAANDYPIDVEIPDRTGHLEPATVRRFHDGYRAGGLSVEGGLIQRGPIERALVRLHASTYDKDLQHNAVMTVPYGEVEYGGDTYGATADVELAAGPWRGRAIAGATRLGIDFEDLGRSVYSWRGEVVHERAIAGELEGEAIDQRTTELGLFARVTGERTLGDAHRLRVALAPTIARRGGTDRTDPNPDGRDPISARRDLTQVVVGVEHEMAILGERLENVAFAKGYFMRADAEDVRPVFVFVPLQRDVWRGGVGDALRLRLTDEVMLKASYEWATRLPSVDEVFGDGILVQPNLNLRPEVSHNVNLGALFDRDTAIGEFGGEINAFARLADQLILLLGNDRYFTYQNVWSARILGVEGNAGWIAPGEWATLDASVTLQDVRNASDEGTFGDFEGDRVPNRPWLLGALGASARRRSVATAGDEVVVFGNSRYVHDFYRGWESLGRPEYKQVVPSQLTHSLGVTYALRRSGSILTTVEVQNLTDARVFDSFGVQRPGRALFVKVAGEL
jgi:vitamin B12 transporter